MSFIRTGSNSAASSSSSAPTQRSLRLLTVDCRTVSRMITLSLILPINFSAPSRASPAMPCAAAEPTSIAPVAKSLVALLAVLSTTLALSPVTCAFTFRQAGSGIETRKEPKRSEGRKQARQFDGRKLASTV